MQWYNHEHRHSAIRFVTPAERHAGLDHALLKKHSQVYEAAKTRHPERWSGNTRNWRPIRIVHLNPDQHVTETCNIGVNPTSPAGNAIRERQSLWHSRPSLWVLGSSVADILIASTLAALGILMLPLPVAVVADTLAAAVAFGFILNIVKIPVFKRLQIA